MLLPPKVYQVDVTLELKIGLARGVIPDVVRSQVPYAAAPQRYEKLSNLVERESRQFDFVSNHRSRIQFKSLDNCSRGLFDGWMGC